MRASSSLIGSTALAAGLLVSMSAAQAAPATLTKTDNATEQATALSHWTRDRIRLVPAFRTPVDHGPMVSDLNAERNAVPFGPLRDEPAGRADVNANEIARAAYFQDWAELERDALNDPLREAPTGTSGIYTSYDVNTQAALHLIFPHIWDGKFTFTTAAGSASCSATSISNNHIVTAAHCVYDTVNNVWYTNKAFTPAYRNGSAPYGTFATTGCTILTSYINLAGGYSIGTWAQHDVAVCRVGNNTAGQTLNGAVGWAGRLWNAGNQQLVFNSGYPARTYTDAVIVNGPAQYLRACTAETFLYAAETLGGGCSWGRGISGGSWMTGYKPFVVIGQVNSVNSGLFIGQQNLYGARFNSNNIEALCTASGC